MTAHQRLPTSSAVTDTPEQGPAWIPCACGEFWCRIHDQHADACDCPGVESWGVDPYSTGGPPVAQGEYLTVQELFDYADRKTVDYG